MLSISVLESIVNAMPVITLAEMDHVKLMRRSDTKFVVSVSDIPDILNEMKGNYRVLEVKGIKTHQYNTTYYDTNEYEMYHNHHNQHLNRYKIRMRQYVANNLFYFEVKFKNNKGETVKKRIKPIDYTHINGQDCVEFLAKYSPYKPSDIKPSMMNRFSRVTLVHNTLPERITLDYDLHFIPVNEKESKVMRGVAVIEVKRDLNAHYSEMIAILKEKRVKKMGFSKYCIGTAMVETQVKKNLFKERISKIMKLNIANN